MKQLHSGETTTSNQSFQKLKKEILKKNVKYGVKFAVSLIGGVHCYYYSLFAWNFTVRWITQLHLQVTVAASTIRSVKVQEFFCIWCSCWKKKRER